MIQYRNKNWLNNQYKLKEKSINKIAKKCNVSDATILNWLRKFEISTRNHSEAGKLMKENKGWIKKGNQNWLGKTHSKESKKKMSISQKARKIDHKNEKNPQWKGDNVGYSALHVWICSHKKKEGICIICNEYKYTDWACIDHNYTRDLENYIELCHSCHKIYDKLRGFING